MFQIYQILYLKLYKKKIKNETIECIGPEIITFKDIILKILQSIKKKRLLLPIPLSLAKINARLFQLLPNPLLTIDQLKLLKYDNIVSKKYKTNFDLKMLANKNFEEQINLYSYNWTSGGQYSKKVKK